MILNQPKNISLKSQSLIAGVVLEPSKNRDPMLRWHAVHATLKIVFRQPTSGLKLLKNGKIQVVPFFHFYLRC